MKRRMIAAALALGLSLGLAGCHSKSDVTEIESLKQQVSDLQIQLDKANASLQSVQSTLVKSWSLEASPLEDGSGAAVTFAAVPAVTSADQTVTFIVMENEDEILRLNCSSDGTRYTASAQLDAKNGYSFYCELSSTGSDTVNRFALLDPSNESLANLMSLKDRLDCYCTFVAEDSEVVEVSAEADETKENEEAQEKAAEESGQRLKLKNVTLTVKLPDFQSAIHPVTVNEAKISLYLGDTEIDSTNVIFSGEGTLLECSMEEVLLKLPAEALTEEQQLTSVLTVTLSTKTLTAQGPSWYPEDDTLKMNAG